MSGGRLRDTKDLPIGAIFPMLEPVISHTVSPPSRQAAHHHSPSALGRYKGGCEDSRRESQAGPHSD